MKICPLIKDEYGKPVVCQEEKCAWYIGISKPDLNELSEVFESLFDGYSGREHNKEWVKERINKKSAIIKNGKCAIVFLARTTNGPVLPLDWKVIED